MSEWQPIKTAPRDGSLIRIRQGQWLHHYARWKDGHWQSVEYSGTHNPTHWMPFQEQPARDVKKKRETG